MTHITRIWPENRDSVSISENQVHCNDAAFVPEFSEGNSGSSFFEWEWTAGSMSRLDGEVKLQTQCLQIDVRFEIPLGLAK